MKSLVKPFSPILKPIFSSFLKEKSINSVFYHGGLDQFQRDGVIEDFKNSKETNILVATDAASHGLNLQFVNFVVNFELLYNPAKMAQRVIALGHTNVFNLEGAIFAWATEGNALEGSNKVHPFNTIGRQMLRDDLEAD